MPAITPTLSSAGLGSGLDVAGIVDRLSAIEKRPLLRLQSDAASIQAKISATGKLTGLADSLRTAALALSRESTWSTMSASSSDAGISSVSVRPGATASSTSASTYDIEVQQTAKAQSLTSGAIPAAADLRGDLTIEVGQWSGSVPPVFVATSGGSPYSVSVTSGSASLSQIRDQINRSSAPIRATIVRDATGERLSVVSTKTGITQAVRVSVSNMPPGSQLAELSYTPDTPPASASGSTPGMRQVVAAANAQARINGIDITSESNTFGQAIEGVDLTVNKVGNAQITVGNDTSSQRKAIESFVQAYNGLIGGLNQTASVDASGKPIGPLASNSSVSALRGQIRSVVSKVGSAADTPSLDNLAEIGLSLQRDGTLKINESRLQEALKSPSQVKALMTGANGAGTRIKNAMELATQNNGALGGTTQGLQTQLKSNQSAQDRLNRAVETQRQRLLEQYQGLDNRIADLKQLSGFVGASLNTRG